MRSTTLWTLGIGLAALLIGASLTSAETKGDPATGKKTYDIYCVTCHGPVGDGQGPVGKTLQPPPRDFTKGDFKFGGADQEIFDIISNGAAIKGGSPLMAPWGAVIPEADRWGLVAYIRTLKK
ncbi:MAG: cytochrome c [Myxococcota bacterium]